MAHPDDEAIKNAEISLNEIAERQAMAYYDKEVKTAGATLIDPRRDIKRSLQLQKNELQMRMAKIENLLGLLENNPDVEKILNLSRELI